MCTSNTSCTLQAEEVLVPSALVTLADRLQLLVAFISEALKEDVERLSDKGKDRMFTSASSLLEKINVLLQKCFGPAEADAVVSRLFHSLLPGCLWVLPGCKLLQTKQFTTKKGIP